LWRSENNAKAGKKTVVAKLGIVRAQSAMREPSTAARERTTWKWAMTKYESWRVISRPALERISPVAPPVAKDKLNSELEGAAPLPEMAQFDSLTDVGTPMNAVRTEKAKRESTSIPAVNI
jgi:hypothetical protein